MLDFETSYSKSEVYSKSNSLKITSFLKNYSTSEGAVSQNVKMFTPHNQPGQIPSEMGG